MAAQPKKTAKVKMTNDLRIPMNAEQMKLIERAAASNKPEELATWAREVLLQAAKSLFANKKTKRKPEDPNAQEKSCPSGEF